MKRNNILLYSIVVLLVIAVFLVVLFFVFFYTSLTLTGYATQVTTGSNVTISKFFSIALSPNVSSEGISFGVVASLPTVFQNASFNYIVNNETVIFANVSTDTNVNVDFCISANAGLNEPTGDSNIPIADERYLNFTSLSNLTRPGPQADSVSLTTTSTKASNPTSAGDSTYYRFWLNVSSGTAAGDYNNTITFTGVETGTAC